MDRLADILLLEDDDQFAIWLAQGLEKAGYSVTRFATASDAIQHLMESNVDLVIADVLIKIGDKLSHEGGITLVGKMKQVLGNPTPVIAISGAFGDRRGGREIEASVKAVGADVTLAKPFKLEALLDYVDRLVIHAGR